jgi:hypothetical protein
MKGLWAETADGWRDSRTDTILTFDNARQLIADRIAELGLDADKVNAFPFQRDLFVDAQAEQNFWRASFEDRMKRFRRG